MSVSQKTKSRRSMLLVLVAFLLPIVLAKLALEQQWFNYGVTNKGQLLENELTLDKLGLDKADFDKHWLLVYALPYDCDSHCEKVLVGVNNTFIALGKEMPRVKPVALTQHQLTDAQLGKIRHASWHIQDMPSLTKNLVQPPQVLIVDPLGNVILAHQPPHEADGLPQFGKNILADMKKLLKYSRIG